MHESRRNNDTNLNGSAVPYELMEDGRAPVRAFLHDHITTLMDEVFEESKKLGVNYRSAAFSTFTIALGIISSFIYIKPNIQEGKSLKGSSKALGLPPELLMVTLPFFSFLTNAVLNTFFTETELAGIIEDIKSSPLSNSTAAKINNAHISLRQRLIKILSGTTYLLFKLVPVLLSAAPYLTLETDEDKPKPSEVSWLHPVYLSTLACVYALMHYKAIGHLVDQFVIPCQKYLQVLSQKQFRGNGFHELSESKEEGLEAHKRAISVALCHFQYLVQINKSDALEKLYKNFDEASGQKVIIELLQILDQEEKKGTFNKINEKFPIHPVLIFSAYATSFIGSIICSLGFSDNTYDEASDLCQAFLGDTPSCQAGAFLPVIMALIAIALFNYLVAIVGAKDNTDKILEYFTDKNPVYSLTFQKNPTVFKALMGGLVFSALFSWGTTLKLNQQYFNGVWLHLINVVSIFFNAYFNALAAPYVANSLTKQYNIAGGLSPEERSNLTIEAFLMNYSGKLKTVESKKFTIALNNFSGNKAVLFREEKSSTAMKNFAADDVEKETMNNQDIELSSVRSPMSDGK